MTLLQTKTKTLLQTKTKTLLQTKTKRETPDRKQSHSNENKAGIVNENKAGNTRSADSSVTPPNPSRRRCLPLPYPRRNQPRRRRVRVDPYIFLQQLQHHAGLLQGPGADLLRERLHEGDGGFNERFLGYFNPYWPRGFNTWLPVLVKLEFPRQCFYQVLFLRGT